jgi:hypothetical protein
LSHFIVDDHCSDENKENIDISEVNLFTSLIIVIGCYVDEIDFFGIVLRSERERSTIMIITNIDSWK